MKLAIVHDWLVSMRGGEKVLEAFCKLFPSADLYTLIWAPGKVSPEIEARPIHTSFLNRLPAVTRYYRWLLPVMPFAMKRVHLRGYDLVLSISHCVANGVTIPDRALRVCYCNTPMRYAWDLREAYFAGAKRGPKYWAFRAATAWLRRWDLKMSQRVHAYIANSRNVRGRIRRCYQRDATVIYPPVDVGYFRPTGAALGDYFLWVGAPAPYKRLDVAIEAFRGLPAKLYVIGDGPDLSCYRRHAPSNVSFFGRVCDSDLRDFYSSCQALVFPGEEDFGLVPVEAQACGRPVIALARGGAVETVRDPHATPHSPPTGILFEDSTPEGLRQAIQAYLHMRSAFDPSHIRRNALRFGYSRFQQEIKKYFANLSLLETSP